MLWHFLFLVLCSGSQFHDLSSTEISQAANSLNKKYAFVSSAKDQYGIPDIGEGSLRGAESCSPTIIRVSDTKSLFKDTERPQILVSGAVHGDERVGPVVSIRLAELLVAGASCAIDRDDTSCSFMKSHNITESEISWLAYLATRRDSYILPVANCFGYDGRRRFDRNGVDPNRDFSYSRKDNECFRSPTAQLFRALFSRSLIQVTLTFHAGMEAIGYEWGTTVKHKQRHNKSPDHESHHSIAKVLSNYGGKFGSSNVYKYDTMNDLVYPVDGSMEDWLYASAWDTADIKKCKLDSGETILNNGRSDVFLVETSNDKSPPDDELGRSTGILKNELSAPDNGHVPRNVRLALAAIDLVQPYVCISNVNDASISWYVGGAINVESTFVQLVQNIDSLNSGDISKSLQPNSFDHTTNTGRTSWSPLKTEQDVYTSKFPDFLHLTDGEYFIVAWAKVDSNWGVDNQGHPKGLKPQSHLANARTNSRWMHTIFSTFQDKSQYHNDLKKVTGRLYWASDPVRIEKKNGKISIHSVVYKCEYWNPIFLNTSISSPHKNVEESIVSNISNTFQKVEENLKKIIDIFPKARMNDSLATKRARFRSQIKNIRSPINLLNVFGYLMIYGGGLYLLIAGGLFFITIAGFLFSKKIVYEVKSS